ncbi:DEAD/DEAH box helicase [Novosphingopyxis iocasae]|uniref:DEAD/DEAH box helicase n=1 Tax=Novosphingopyxis iocasae TaxID=2762729 RepID=UPI001651241B|nr:DEAD/DEAH box helicase [Novosphingopyxis iocasae]
MPFNDIAAPLAEALAARGYDNPTAVQAAVLEDEAAGRDLVVSAQTGSGKTIAFGLAVAAELMGEDNRLGVAAAPLALVIAPTRELALQVSRELGWLYEKAGAVIATCVGGMDPVKERRVLRQGAHIVVGTPGRLRDHFERNGLDLSDLRTAVLDEADEMLDMGFRDDLEEILDGTPDQRRTLLFSATMPKPIVALAKRYQRDALRISTVGEDRGHGDIAYQAVTVAPHEIEHAVVNLLRFHDAETAIVFCATRESVRRMHASLQERGFAVVALSGEHSQSERNHAMQALRDGRARVCVATDVAARGIDLPALSLVIHAEIPRDAETLQHRSGRTGRAGNKGTAVLVVPYPRRRRVESMLRGAKVQADWIDAPTPEAIRAQDQERLLTALLEPADYDEEELRLADRLLAERSPRDIAAALVQIHRAKMPAPEELIENSPEARKEAQKERHRPGFEDIIWFRMDAGRRQNADPRWILPLLCRRGHITKKDVGAIRIGPDETFFQIPRAVSGDFEAALRRTANSDEQGDPRDDITITQSPEGPAERTRPGRKPKHESKPANAGRPKLHRKEGGGDLQNQPSGKTFKPKFAKGKGGAGKPFGKGKFDKGKRGGAPKGGAKPFAKKDR